MKLRPGGFESSQTWQLLGYNPVLVHSRHPTSQLAHVIWPSRYFPGPQRPLVQEAAELALVKLRPGGSESSQTWQLLGYNPVLVHSRHPTSQLAHVIWPSRYFPGPQRPLVQEAAELALVKLRPGGSESSQTWQLLGYNPVLVHSRHPTSQLAHVIWPSRYFPGPQRPLVQEAAELALVKLRPGGSESSQTWQLLGYNPVLVHSRHPTSQLAHVIWPSRYFPGPQRPLVQEAAELALVKLRPGGSESSQTWQLLGYNPVLVHSRHPTSQLAHVIWLSRYFPGPQRPLVQGSPGLALV